jgi:ATP-binding cassette subfamily B protein
VAGVEITVLALIAQKLRVAAAELSRLPRALKLAWAAARLWTALWAALLVLQGLLPVSSVYLTRPLVNRILAAIKAGGTWESIRPAVAIGVLIAAIALLSEILRSATVWVRTHQSELVQDYITALIQRKSAEIDLAFYDSAEFYDRLHRARSEASYRPVLLLESLSGILQNSITLTAMLAVLAPFGVWLPMALLVSTLPALYVVLRNTVRQHEWRQRTTADERRTWYYDWLLTSYEAASELRLFALGERFQSAYGALRRRLRGEKFELAQSQAVGEFAAGALALLAGGASLLWMTWRAIRGWITPGDLALFYQAFQQGLGLMRSLLQNLGQLYYSSLFLGNLFEFLALEPTVLSPPSPGPMPPALEREIHFERVTFQYPGAREPTLSDFSLTIPAGRIVSLVGPNGAGKSTFVKLLCRFYDPAGGRIELDGRDLRSFQIDELRRHITALFQEPVRYNATAAENIVLGDQGASEAEIESAAAAAGADEIIRRLPAGYDNLLGKLFIDGAGLSTGEWQRIALARAFLRQAPILILDEPTSAMDPWAEADWIDRFRSLAHGRTAILITHRLTTAMRADEIHVFFEGRVVESGSHEELLKRGGLYAQSWARQESSPMAQQGPRSS